MDMDLSVIALGGLQQAAAQLEKAATRIASFGAGSPDGVNVDTVDLSAEIVALMSAKNQTSLNLGTLKIADEIQKNTIDMIA
jgi:hypothetical protein